MPQSKLEGEEGSLAKGRDQRRPLHRVVGSQGALLLPGAPVSRYVLRYTQLTVAQLLCYRNRNAQVKSKGAVSGLELCWVIFFYGEGKKKEKKLDRMDRAF